MQLVNIVQITIRDGNNSVQITPSQFLYNGSSGVVSRGSSSSFQPVQSYFGFSSQDNNMNNSFQGGYTWNTIKFNSIGANNISGLTYSNGEF